MMKNVVNRGRPIGPSAWTEYTTENSMPLNVYSIVPRRVWMMVRRDEINM